MSFGMIRKRPVLSACLALAMLAVLLEVGSYAVIVLAGKNFYFPLALNDVSEESLPDRVKATFSEELGWEPNHPNKHGYRGPEKPLADAALAVFGDGYAEGSRSLEKSWPHLLEQRLGRPVLNFGVGAYGPDQAYLRFEERYVDPIETPYTALIMMSGGMARIMNRYRGFYVRGSEIRYPKPMFERRADGGFALIANPVTSPEELAKLGDLAFLQALGEGDYWYDRFERYGLNDFVGFPYAYHLAKAVPYYWKRWRDHARTDGQSYQQLYRNEDATATLHHIVERFIDRAKERGTTPIFVMLPNRADLAHYMAEGTTSYAAVLDELKQVDHPYIYDGLAFYLPSIEGGAALDSFFVAEGNDWLSPHAETLISDGMHSILTSIDSGRDRLAAQSSDATSPH